MKYLSVHVVDTAGDELIDFDQNFGLLDLTYLHPMYDCSLELLSATDYQLDEYYEHSSCGYLTMTFGYIVCCRWSTE